MSTQLVVHKKTGVPRNPAAKAYYEKHPGDQARLPPGKRDRTRLKKALLSLMRVQAIRFYKLMKLQKLVAEAQRAQEGAEPAWNAEMVNLLKKGTTEHCGPGS